MSSEESQYHQDDATAAAAHPSISTNSSGLFTPSGLFIVLNLMIFTIALSSKLSNRKTTRNHHDQEEEEEDVSHHHHHQTDDDTHFPAAAADNFQQFRYQHVSNQENMSPPPNSSSSSPTIDSYVTDDDNNNSSYVYEEPPQETTEQIPKPKKIPRVKSDVRPKQLRKSWSARSSSSSSDYNNNNKNKKEDDASSSVEKRRPSTVREGNKEVDAMADDFINRFKHQLKLQRMDSFSRYRSDKKPT